MATKARIMLLTSGAAHLVLRLVVLVGGACLVLVSEALKASLQVKRPDDEAIVGFRPVCTNRGVEYGSAGDGPRAGS